MVGDQAEHAAPSGDKVVARRMAIEEEAEIEEIVRPAEEAVNRQRVFAARRCDDEWVVYEEDHSSKAIRKLQRMVDDLVGQVKVSVLRASKRAP